MESIKKFTGVVEINKEQPLMAVIKNNLSKTLMVLFLMSWITMFSSCFVTVRHHHGHEGYEHHDHDDHHR